jgi:hypothetical protein
MQKTPFAKIKNRIASLVWWVAFVAAFVAVQTTRAGEEKTNRCFVPGEVWRDTAGNPNCPTVRLCIGFDVVFDGGS